VTDATADTGVDLGIVAAWMDEQGFAAGPIEGVHHLSGGTQNVMLRFTRGGADYVLRRGPLHLRKHSNDAIRREMQVLQALAGTDVPHPGFIAGCRDESVLGGAVFYLMEPVSGFNPTVELPAYHAGDEAVRHAMGLDAADALARLGAVDHVAAGLGDVGNPEGFLERQVTRWVDELDSYNSFEGYPGAQLPGVDEVGGWLDANRPQKWSPGIMHGDYHLANLMYEYDSPRVAAIVDWEMCTIGDPLLDLGWLLATWPTADGLALGPASGLGAYDGFPTPAELVARYAERSARDTAAMDWYTVLACFKLGIILEGTHARACAGKAPPEVGDLLHAITLGLFAKARSLI
jgi:aminoglycoside phosphotransferase (APT) family kinase protein